MARRFQDRLNQASGRFFVGRKEERSLFRQLLTEEEPSHLVLFVHGSGGIGKSSLLKSYQRICRSEGVRSVLLDARAFGESQGAFTEQLRQSLQAAQDGDLLAALEQDGTRLALLIDTFELAGSLESWLVREFLPSLPANVVVVLAGRDRPSDEWRREPGWSVLMRPLPLRNLKRSEAFEMLIGAGVPEEKTEHLLTHTLGHPLAVSLVLELFQLTGDPDFNPRQAPDVVQALVERLVMKVPSPSHRLALEACALTHAMTEDLLAGMLDAPDVSILFDWLRSLGFMESIDSGLVPHDVAREALAAELRWRNPGQYRELHRRARQYYLSAMHATRDKVEQRRHLRDLVFLHRDNPVVQPLYLQLRAGHGRPEANADTLASEADRQAVINMISRHEGSESAELAAGWMRSQPDSLVLFRDASGAPSGVLFVLDLGTADPTLVEQDPGMRAPARHLEQTAPLREGECATVFRFWLSAQEYQHLSYVQMTIFVHMVQHYLMQPGLAYTYLPSLIADDLEQVMAYGDIYRIHEADFEVGGRKFGMFGHDWRIRPPEQWMELMGRRQLGAVPEASRPQPSESMVVLDREDFEECVREALKHHARPRHIKDSPLLRSALVVNRSNGNDPAARVEVLRELLSRAVEKLNGMPRMDKAYRAMDRTYLRPAGSQEAAAELLDMPYSTFRRHLGRGVEEVAEALWQQEIDQV